MDSEQQTQREELEGLLPLENYLEIENYLYTGPLQSRPRSPGLPSTAVDWSDYEGLVFKNDRPSPPAVSQIPLSGFSLSRQDNLSIPSVTYSSTLTDLSEIEDRKVPSVPSFHPQVNGDPWYGFGQWTLDTYSNSNPGDTDQPSKNVDTTPTSAIPVCENNISLLKAQPYCRSQRKSISGEANLARAKQANAEQPEECSNTVKKKPQSLVKPAHACDRCKVRRMRCHTTPRGCSQCFRSATYCRTTDRITGRATLRGYSEGPEQQNSDLRNAKTPKEDADRKKAFSTNTRSRSNTFSSFEEDDTDWGDDDIPANDGFNFSDFSSFSALTEGGSTLQEELKNRLTRPILSPMKQALIDSIMKDFWSIFDQETGNSLDRDRLFQQPSMVSNDSSLDISYDLNSSSIAIPVESQCLASFQDSALGLEFDSDDESEIFPPPSKNNSGDSGIDLIFDFPLIDTIKPSGDKAFKPESAFAHHTTSGSYPKTSRIATAHGGEAHSTAARPAADFGRSNTHQATSKQNRGKRGREDEDDPDQNDGEDGSPKRPRKFTSPIQNEEDSRKFACPYRKRDPRKYCIQDWRPCALTPLETIARVKGHLYRHHRIFPCQRCKQLFSNQNEVNSHLRESVACELSDDDYPDGVTADIVERLRSKKTAQRTENERWQDIYKLLFPDEMVPSPYFEPVQEDLISSPDSRELADYEAYCRRELPRAFRAALEEIVQSQSQPIEESIRNQMTNIIRDCQDRIFSRFRSSMAAATTPSRTTRSSQSPTTAISTSLREPADMGISTSAPSGVSAGRISPTFLQPPPPQSHLESRLEFSKLQNDFAKPPSSSDPSDSGYSSNGNGSLIGSSSANTSMDNLSWPSSQDQMTSWPTGPSFDMGASFDINDGIQVTNPGNCITNSNYTNPFDSPWYDGGSQLADEGSGGENVDNTSLEDFFGPSKIP